VTIIFRQLLDPSTRAYTYVLGDETSRDAVAIDAGPPGNTLPLLGLRNELDLRLRYLLCTHVHPKQPLDLPLLQARTGARVVASETAPVDADLRVRHGDSVTFGGESLTVIATPGHAPGALCFLWRDRVFTGDTLLIRDCGRIDAPDGDAGQLFDSITQRLLVLPGDTLLFPGHETYGRTVSTIAEEREHNPCVTSQSRDEFITRRRLQ